jgi:hypothetical protein
MNEPYRTAPMVTNVTKHYDFSSLGHCVSLSVFILVIGAIVSGLFLWAREYQRTCTDSEHPIYSDSSWEKRCDAHAVGTLETIPADKDHGAVTTWVCRCETNTP